MQHEHENIRNGRNKNKTLLPQKARRSSTIMPSVTKHLLFKPNDIEEKFFRWCFQSASSNVSLHENVRVRKAPSKGYDLMAAGKIPKGSVLVNVPPTFWKPYSAGYAVDELKTSYSPWFKKLLTFAGESMPNQPSSAKTLVDSVSLGVHMLLESTSGKSPYANFLRYNSYPLNKHALPHPLLMQAPSFIDRYLHNTKLQKDIVLRQSLFEKVAGYVLAQGKADRNSPIVTEFLWSMGTVLSRAVSGQDLPLTFVPFLDLANHGDTSLTQYLSHNVDVHNEKETVGPNAVNAKHVLEPASEHFALIAERDIHAGESICISYGTKRDTNSFMTIYGFLGDYTNVNDRLHTTIVPVSSPSSATASTAVTPQHYTFLQSPEKIRLFQELLKSHIRNPEILSTYAIQCHAKTGIVCHLPIQEDETREEQLLLLLWIVKIASFVEQLPTPLPTNLASVSLPLKLTTQDQQALIQYCDHLVNQYITPQRFEAFGFQRSNSSEEDILNEFILHLETLAVKLLPQIDSMENPFHSKEESTTFVNAEDYWKSCCARVILKELLTVLTLRIYSERITV